MKREIENQEYAKMLKRMILNAGKRFSDSGPDDLVFLMEIKDLLDEQISNAILSLNESGYSLDQIAKPLKTSRQNLHRKYFSSRKVA